MQEIAAGVRSGDINLDDLHVPKKLSDFIQSLADNFNDSINIAKMVGHCFVENECDIMCGCMLG